ncbi:MAG: ribonuclease E/G [Tissierellia bacterium]|nr:ribonuclease E/G [Tissierellia bacterium]
MNFIFIDEKRGIIGKVNSNKVIEIKFISDSLVGNIYRGKIINELSFMDAYFVELSKYEIGFLKTKEKFSIGESVIVQVVRDSSNDKKALVSLNYKLETKDYYLKRYSKNKDHIYRKNRKNDKSQIEYLKSQYKMLLRQENFSPSPKLLIENNPIKKYISNNKELELIYVDIYKNKIINDSLKLLNDGKIYYKDYSIIIDELETLTVIDVNTESYTSKGDKNYLFYKINEELVDFILYILKFRNISGMIVIDFLRSDKNESLKEIFSEKINNIGIKANIFGFSNMGLFEMTIERHGESLKREFQKRLNKTK